MKIIADQQIPHVLQAFSEFAEVTLCHGRKITSELIYDADILLVRSTTPVNASLLEGSQIKFVATATSGLDHIDQQYLQQNNIGFTHAQGSNARSVAEYVLSSLFVLADQNNFKLKDKTVGVIGCGEVGSRVVNLLAKIGVQTIMNDPPLKDITEDNSQYCELEDVLSADIISLHIPLIFDGSYPTKNLVDIDFLSRLNDDVILLNTSRGGVVDETALKIHLDNYPDIKIVLDVWEGEPTIDSDLLSQIAIGTPHIAGYSTDGKIRAIEMIFHAVCDFLKKECEWRKLADLPDANMSELHLSENVDEEDAIQMAVLASYDVRSDSASLRRLPEISLEQRSQFFDELRKNYPVRREFPATKIYLSASRKILAEKLKQLGFVVELTE